MELPGVTGRAWMRSVNLDLGPVQAVTAWAHGALGVSRVWLEVNPRNMPSLRLAERAGCSATSAA